MAPPQADLDQIRQSLDVLFELGDVVELRAFKNRRCTISGYYDDFDRLARDAAKVNRSCGGVYVTLNQIDNNLLARRANRYVEYADTTTSDPQVLRRRWLPIDLDPQRPAGISASDAEHQAALALATTVRNFLVEELDFPEPLQADSGNGAHLLFHIDLPNDEEAADLVQQCLATLDARFSNDQVSVDVGNYNASRIWKLYGTVARKGDHTDERPHRVARLLSVPEPIEVVPVEKVVVWNRTDGNLESRLANFRLLLLDASRKTVAKLDMKEPPKPNREMTLAGPRSSVPKDILAVS